jgi:hypothetical protein
MGYDPIGNMLTGTTEASIDPISQQQAYESNRLAAAEEEERKRQQEMVAQQEAEAAVQQKQKEEAASANPVGEVGAAVVGGLVDFTDDVLEVGGKIVGQEWEAIPEDWGPQNKTQWGKAARAIVSFIGPTIGVGSLTKAGIMQVAKMAKYANTSKAVSIIGNLGVEMAAGTAVDAINSHSEEDNLSGYLKKQFPGTFDWLPDDLATLDTDSPDLKRKKNILEGAGLGLIASVIEGSVAFARGLKGMDPGVVFKPKDEAAKAAFTKDINKSPQTRSAHPIIDRILKDENYRQQHIDEMALRELEELGGIDYVDRYSPNLHSEVSDLSETIPHAVKPDAIPQMMVDNARILSNIDTYYGRPAKFHTDAFIKSMDLNDMAGRKVVKFLDDKIKEYGNFEAVLPNGRMMNKKELLEAGDELAAKILDPNMKGKALRELLDGYRDKIQIITNAPSAKPLNAEGSTAAKTALKELGALYLNSDMQRASAYIQVGLAGESADLANAARVMSDGLDTTYIQERILDKMETLWFETDMSSSIKGWALNNEKIWQEAVKARNSNPNELKAFGREALEAFKTAKKLKAEQNRTFWVGLKEMNQSNPEFLSPLMRAYELTDGDVNSIHKLNNYMKEVLGVTNKAFIDGNPQIPSQVVQGMWATLYNLKLSSLLTPVKAMSNNFALLLMKPMNVAMGAAMRGDWHTLQRSWMQYTTHMDTTMKASSDYMSQMFKRISADPSITQRLDFKTTTNEMLTLAREFAEAEASKGRYGAAFKMQWVDTMQKINDHPWVRYSMNFMESGDAFVKAAVGMSEARGRAYDDLFKQYGRAPNAEQLQKAAADIYNQMFDKNGLITDSAVKYASSEIAMNLDNEFAAGLNSLLEKAPLLKTVVLFPRTSINVLDFIHKHSPLSYFIGDLQKTRNLKDADEIAQFLATKGIDVAKQPLEQAWKSYRAEVEGRVAMGTMMVTMGGWMFASGNLTGNGHYDKQVNKFQQNAGDKPLRSWKGIDGKWRSYDGIEPIATFLALTADILQNSNSLGTTASEQMLQKLGYAVSMNLTNKSFLQGLQPISDLLSGQPAALSRWASNTASVGILNQMARIMMPGLREVDTDLGSMMRNKYNILDVAGLGKALPKAYDFIDGSVVGDNDPITNFLNNTLPFKTNSDPSPVKQFLIDTEFDVQPALKKSLRGATYTAEQRSRLSQIMGESGHFRTGLELLMSDKRVTEDLKAIQKARQSGVTQDQADLADSYTHTRIRRLLTQTLNLAKRQLADEVPDIRMSELTAKKTRRAQLHSDYGTVLQLQNK